MIDIKEQIQFGDFNSKDFGLYLIERNAPSPEEKEIIEDIPFMQGVLDFSSILGDRVFSNRVITYKFILPNTIYGGRKAIENKLKRALMLPTKNRLYDSHDLNYFWHGKCKSVEVEDDEEFRRFFATIEFDVYPFLFHYKDRFDDLWDDFAFNDDVAQWSKYWIPNAPREITFYNTSDITVSPTIEVDSKAETPLYSPVPVGNTVQVTPATYYTVVSGDYLYSIAVKFGITVSDLRAWNSLTTDVILSGQKLIVKPQVTTIVETKQVVVGSDVWMRITTNTGEVINLVNGLNKLHSFKLSPGENKFIVEGYGTIKFFFRKEVMA